MRPQVEMPLRSQLSEIWQPATHLVSDFQNEGKNSRFFLRLIFLSLASKIRSTPYTSKICYTSISRWLDRGLFVAYRVQCHKTLLAQSLQVFLMPLARLTGQCVFLHTPSSSRLRETAWCFRSWFVGEQEASDFTMSALPHSHAENSLIAHPRRRHQPRLWAPQ